MGLRPIWVVLAIAAAIAVGFWFGFRPLDTLSLSPPLTGEIPPIAPPTPPVMTEPPGGPLPEPLLSAFAEPAPPALDFLDLTPARSEIPEPQAAREPQATPEPQATREPQATGRLKIDSDPPSTVYIDKKKIGPTPITGIQLPVGSHSVVLRNESLGLMKRKRIRIDPGGEHEVFLRLEEKR